MTEGLIKVGENVRIIDGYDKGRSGRIIKSNLFAAGDEEMYYVAAYGYNCVGEIDMKCVWCYAHELEIMN